MAELTVTTFLSLDGVMQGPGGPEEDRSGGFDRGGWLVPFFSDDMGAFVSEWFAQAGSFLLGRRTFEIFQAFWPLVTDPNDPVASRLNSLPKYVATTTLDSVNWGDTTLIGDDLVERVTELKKQPGAEIQVHGSGDLLQTLMKHNLIDEYRLWIYPVVVGKGEKLFRDGGPSTSLRLLDSKTTSTGVTVNTYRPAGELQTGTVTIDNP